MWSHFILALSLLATFIECRPDQNNKKLKAAIKENSDEEYDNNYDSTYEGSYSLSSKEKKTMKKVI